MDSTHMPTTLYMGISHSQPVYAMIIALTPTLINQRHDHDGTNTPTVGGGPRRRFSWMTRGLSGEWLPHSVQNIERYSALVSLI